MPIMLQSNRAVFNKYAFNPIYSLCLDVPEIRQHFNAEYVSFKIERDIYTGKLPLRSEDSRDRLPRFSYTADLGCLYIP